MRSRIALIFAICMLCAGSASAQEFSMKVHCYSDTFSNNPAAITFGYDPVASDSMTDTQFGEFLLPGLYELDALELRLVNYRTGRLYLQQDGSDGGYTDIRRKPAGDSFVLNYETFINTPDTAKVITYTWDNSAIPAVIKHIYLYSDQEDTAIARLDMKTSTSFVVKQRQSPVDSQQYFYTRLLIGIVYNDGIEAVADPAAENNVSLYPSVLNRGETECINVASAGEYTITAFDMLGRSLISKTIAVASGQSPLFDLFSAASSGVYAVTVTDAKSGAVLAHQKICIH